MKRRADKCQPCQSNQKTFPQPAKRQPPAELPALDASGEASDEVLMRQAQRGDGQAFAILYQRHGPSISGYLRRMLGNVEDTEGLAQEVFLRAFRFAPTYRYPNRFTTWLFTIARNLAINSARSRHRNPVRDLGDWSLDAASPGGPNHASGVIAPDDVDKQEEIARVLAAMEGLPATQKEVIVLRLFQDLTYEQIGQLMGASAVTLRSRMFHGLRKLATLVSESESAGPAMLENHQVPDSTWGAVAQ